METGNLRYYGLGALTGLTIVGWLLDKVGPDITLAVFVAIGGILGADMLKHKDGK